MTNAAVTVNLKELSSLATAIKHAQPDVAKEIGLELKKAGDIVAVEARVRAARSSSRIPGSIKTTRSGFNVTVRAGSSNAPHAAAFEHEGRGGSFRHPVFGNREVWVSQPAHPFLWPSYVAKQEQFTLGVIRALDVIFREAGFH